MILSQCDSSSRAGCIKDLGIRGVLVSFFSSFFPHVPHSGPGSCLKSLTSSCFPIMFFRFGFPWFGFPFFFFCIDAPLHLAGCFVFCIDFLSIFFSFQMLNSVFSPPSFSSCPWLLWDVLKFKLAGVFFSFLSPFFPFNRIFPVTSYQTRF